MNIDQTKVQLCQPKTVIVSAGFNALQDTYSGIVSLNTRIDNVVAFRVKYFNITLFYDDLSANTNGTIFLLESSRLASNSNHNKFVTVRSSAPSTLQSAIDDSAVIGWSSIVTTDVNTSSAAMQQDCNHLQVMSRPLCIENFDWTILPLASPLPPVNHAYNIEFVIEFYSECQCQKRYIDLYGSK